MALGNIYVKFMRLIFQQTVGIQKGYNYTPTGRFAFVFVWNILHSEAYKGQREKATSHISQCTWN